MIELRDKKDLEAIDSFLKGRKFSLKRFESDVRKIIDDIRENGDEALFKYTQKFDGFLANADNIIVKSEDIEKASGKIADKDKEIIMCAAERIERFHRAFLPKSGFIEEDGIILGNRVTPVESAGLYIPGGKAAYPSTALMSIIPAVIAGVKEISIATPAKGGVLNPYVLYIAGMYKIDRIYKIGGAQAIAAFAYSTETVRKVDVIVGPGNVYVAAAKKMVFGDVAIDSVAGPSEIMIIADGGSKVEFLARDLLSQSEHDEMAGCYFVGLDRRLVEKVELLFGKLSLSNPRSEITEKSAKNALFIYTDSLDLAAEITNIIAPEHLELHLEDPYVFMNKINNAGAIFIGEYTPEPMGDYVAGPNHTLPTSSTARFFSPLSCETFMKRSSILHFSKEGFDKLAHCASEFARLEGLFAHGDAVDVRRDRDI